MSKIEESVYLLIKDKISELNIEIYDIEYVKEGSEWYLRIYIDKENGVDISDCENISRLIEPIIDKEDPIKTPYYLEVSSPGIERTLKKQEHFDKFIGSMVEVSLFNAFEGKKKIAGELAKADENEVEILIDGKNVAFDRKNISKVKTIYNF
jgi:ribosome maturation factor RimP